MFHFKKLLALGVAIGALTIPAIASADTRDDHDGRARVEQRDHERGQREWRERQERERERQWREWREREWRFHHRFDRR